MRVSFFPGIEGDHKRVDLSQIKMLRELGSWKLG